MKDQRGRALIRAKLRRMSVGHVGDCKGVGDGVSELRIHFGPGYRVYFAKEAHDVIVLWGGEKRSQVEDIARAKIYWTEYSNRRGA
ncbi:MAG TPA: type II toxin-antitoxin system RelE/ParE family toxin [Bryobacteraceae bacterium]|nr:type II toxin-antitoxin system RelE/ParE family toxin [Bryobacteraceae bacterium]